MRRMLLMLMVAVAMAALMAVSASAAFAQKGDQGRPEALLQCRELATTEDGKVDQELLKTCIALFGPKQG